jgi:hypothetical protein
MNVRRLPSFAATEDDELSARHPRKRAPKAAAEDCRKDAPRESSSIQRGGSWRAHDHDLSSLPRSEMFIGVDSLRLS